MPIHYYGRHSKVLAAAETNAVVGSPEFMSPEQADVVGKRVSYSLRYLLIRSDTVLFTHG